ncbi:MAG: DNA (cytosine-5-)-methyltransferase [Candidatus Omnitrophica bacterium]|nr:DNA (cytosine-5-)-methyltransferase [Candidatus Omnitrophota bacterium]
MFAGGGGLSKGFMNAGYNLIAAFDNWKPACDLYRRNFTSHDLIECDLESKEAVSAIAAYAPNIIIGGPPCQDFSSAGKRNEGLGRADLTVSFAKIISNIRPQFFVMENVERAIKSKTLARARRIFNKAEYGLTIQVLNAALCGVPQLRKRLFVIGELNGRDNFLLDNLDSGLSDQPMSLRDFFGDQLGFTYYYRHPRSYKRRGIFSVDEPSPTIRGVNRPVPSGYKGHPGDPTTINRNIRALTTRERSLIQTFPKYFHLHGSKTDVEQIIGNAVPVKLSEYVAVALRSYILNTKNPLQFVDPIPSLLLSQSKTKSGDNEYDLQVANSRE